MTFSDPEAISALGAMSPEQLDELPFGVIGMTLSGVVTAYNAFEAQFADMTAESVIGRHFFRDVAPCTNNHMVSGIYDFEKRVDLTIPYVFTLRAKPERVTLRLLKDDPAALQFLLVERTPDA
jgi:photoactive yellow protein